MPHCTENHTFLFQTSWKDGLSKTVALEYDLSCIIEKDQDQKSFSLILYLNRKMKMIVIKKIHRNMIFSWNFLKRWSFQKDRAGMGMIFFVLSGKMVFFWRKHDIFSLGRKWEMTFLKKYMEIWYFLWTRTDVTNVVPRPSAKENQRWSYPAKIHLKIIDALDWHPRKSSSNSLYFLGDLYRRFHVLLSSKRNRKLNIYDWSLSSFSIYSVGDIPQWIIFNTLYRSAPRSCVWRCAWVPIKEIICPLGDGLWFQKCKSSSKNF